jgi:hypothetical protein
MKNSIHTWIQNFLKDIWGLGATEFSDSKGWNEARNSQGWLQLDEGDWIAVSDRGSHCCSTIFFIYLFSLTLPILLKVPFICFPGARGSVVVKALCWGRAIALAVSRRRPTAAARVETRVWSCGILCWTKVALGQVFRENTSVSPANLHFICFSTITITYHPGLAQ